MSTAVAYARSSGSLTGKVFIVTGSSSGIGKECVKALYAAGGTVFMACRPGAKASAALAEVRNTTGAAEAGEGVGKVELLDLDLGLRPSVEACAAAFNARGLPLHALINNAGINGVPKWAAFTPGIETQFAVNFLGHFQLTRLLHDRLKTTPGARVIIVSSESHRRVQEGGFDLDCELRTVSSGNGYDPLHAYAFSNLCRIWWARQLASEVSYPVVCLHPGVIGGTGMMQHMSMQDAIRQVCLMLIWELAPVLAGMKISEGARTQTWAAVVPTEEITDISGAYLNGNPGQELGKPDTPSHLAQNDELARRIVVFAESLLSITPQ
uniref:Protochlorophyllide reductase n=1 Tax=Pyrodinium bahamense TaxID=73915 RepID=A0A7S0A010_9DINO|mmetsp:Transcript_17066/g.46983  ORF Transcript_17066/g.46983 Transcript_17066/m.46983 type:complete len:324 (+) Transcript_17066:106-1077(+)|eukprot:CAMPEP_0179102056 /NCGR_PEP_ID=MMETSP0796-20121207/47217_1 /TAXON_ID=73915 /ORGANISM="Pyrodinium bahamense, Strain pbaha01" /LENGTH=323 /DNA_ID=CAMNT_0020799923 /DNA_START=98 /DNA_END=1069 /DNA_ORIENTATION=-